MNEIRAENLKPGTVLKVRSTSFPLVMHWGVVGFGRDTKGYPLVWHSQKSDILRCTPFEEFSAGQSCELGWVPQNENQAPLIIRRLQSKAGLPWHLTQANCEMVVRWAVEDKPVSYQLIIAFVAAILVVGIVAHSASSA